MLNHSELLILERISDGFCFCNNKWEFTYVNHQAEQLFNRCRQELLGKQFWQEFPSAVDTVLYQELQKATALQVIVVFECFYEYLNVWLEVRGYPSPYGIDIYFRDITKEKEFEIIQQVVVENTAEFQNKIIQLEQEISKRKLAEAYYKSLVDMAPQNILIKDLAGRITFANQAVLATTGISLDECVGKTVYDLYPQELADKYQADDEWVIKTGKLLDKIEPYKSSIGDEIIYIQILKSPVINAAGEVIGTQVIFWDVSERQRVVETIRHSEQALRTIFNSVNHGIFIHSLDGSIIDVNEKMLQMYGVTHEEALQLSLVKDFSCADNLLEELPNIWARVGAGENVLFEWKAKRPKDGDVFDVEVFLSKINLGNQEVVLANVQDISEQKRIVAALRKQQLFNEKVAETNPNVLYLYDIVEHRNVYANRRGTEILGYTSQQRQKFQDHVLATLTHPEDLDALMQHLQRMATSGENGIFEIEYRMQAATGEWRWFRSRDTIFAYGEDGKAKQVLGAAEDITERKLAEIALRESEARYRSLVQATAQIVWTTDANGKPVDGADWASYLGYNCAQLQELGWLVAVHPDDRDRTLQAWKHAVTTQTIYELEHRLLCRDGKYHYFFARAVPVVTADGTVREWVGTHTDITASKQVEVELRYSEAKYRELATSEALLNRLASQIRASLDLNTILATAASEVRQKLNIDRCHFLWYRAKAQPPYWEVVQEARNSAVPGYLGWRVTHAQIQALAQQTLNRKIVRIDDVDSANYPAATKQLLKSLGYTAALSLPIHTKSRAIGVLVCSHSTCSRPWLDREVKLLQAVADQLAIAIDQAELYKQSHLAAQTAQEQAAKLELALQKLASTQAQLIQTEKMSSLGLLVAGIAHEINNPINFIYGNISHAEEYATNLFQLISLYQQHYPEIPGEIQICAQAIDLNFITQDFPKTLASMRLGAERICQIVSSLRNFSRLDEAGMKPVDIHEGIDSTLLILQNRLKESSLHPAIEIVKEYGNLPLVECYAGQLNQVFMNIINNAIDAFLFSHTSSLKSHNKQGQHHHFPASNYKVPTIFISTEKIDNQAIIRIADNGCGMAPEVQRKVFDPFFTTKPVGAGTGLGMSISYQIVVEKHHGKLQCFSTPGHGCEFIISIPISQKLLS